MQLTIPTIDEIRAVIRDVLSDFFSSNQFQPQIEADEIGGIDLAVKITGLAKATIYALCSKRRIPHSKKNKNLYFSRKELTEWIKSGRRKTVTELAVEAESFSPSNSRKTNKTYAVR